MNEAAMDEFCQTVHCFLLIGYTALSLCVWESLNVYDHVFEYIKLGGLRAL